MKRLCNGGFTLIEVLTAIFIFAVMSVIAYGGIASMLDTNKSIETENGKLKELSMFYSRLERDLGNAVERTSRGRFDQILPPFIGLKMPVSEDESHFSFVRLGSPHDSGFNSSSSRIGYLWKDGAINLLVWPVLDQGPRTAPVVYKMLDDISDFSVTYLDAAGEWFEEWAEPTMPKAVKLRLSFIENETFVRIFALR